MLVYAFKFVAFKQFLSLQGLVIFSLHVIFAVS